MRVFCFQEVGIQVLNLAQKDYFMRYLLVYCCSQENQYNMLTIKAEILKTKQKVDNTYNLKIRLTYNREVRRLATHIFVRTEDLTKGFKLKNPKYIKEADRLVRYYQELCTSLPLESSKLTISDILDYIQKEKEKNTPIDFLQFCNEWLETTKVKGKVNYKSALNTFKTFLGKDKLNTSQVTKLLMMEFMDYLQEKRAKHVAELQKKGKRIPSNRMVSLYMGSIRHLFYEAKKKYNDYDRNVIRIPNSPFENLEIPKQEATRKRAVSPELIKKIWEIPYIINANGRERLCPFNLAKDCFILSFCLIGMNSADLYNCTELEEDSITYYRTKTADRRLDKAKMRVDVLPILLPLIKKYEDYTHQKVFCFYHLYSTYKNFNRAINLGLKQIGKILKVDDLEYYAARHSWATIAVNKVGIDKYTVHAALNHIDEAMKVTDIYIERDFKIENEANKKVVEYVFGNQGELSSPEVE